MIENLQYVLKKGIMMSYEWDGIVKEIRFKDIKPHWKYATSTYFENGHAQVCGEDQIIFSMITAGGQGGIIVVWNAREDKVEHVSNGDYSVGFSVHDGYVLTLCNIMNFVTPAHLVLFAVPLGTMDASCEGVRLYCQNPCQVKMEKNEFDLEIDKTGLYVISDQCRYKFSSSIAEAFKQKPAEGFEYLYQKNDDNFNERKNLLNMLT